jgi:hypothetical protein
MASSVSINYNPTSKEEVAALGTIDDELNEVQICPSIPRPILMIQH